MHQISLILMNSMSFGVYLISGTQCANLGQNGIKPRSAGLPLCHLIVQLLRDGPERDIKQITSVQHDYN